MLWEIYPLIISTAHRRSSRVKRRINQINHYIYSNMIRLSSMLLRTEVYSVLNLHRWFTWPCMYTPPSESFRTKLSTSGNITRPMFWNPYLFFV